MVRRELLLAFGAFLVCAPALAQAPASPVKAESVPGVPIQVEGRKIWLGRESEFEEFLKQAKVIKVDDVPVGVTKPKRAYVAPGGLAGSFVFKELMPSRKTGFFESYKSEIAAYELDKIMGMGMVPPTVERKHDGVTGSAQLWVEHCTLLRDRDTTKAPDMGAWNKQVYRQRVWDNLTANIDRNQGNLLMDDGWNLILIDHSRAFTGVDDHAVSDEQDRQGVLREAQGARRGHDQGGPWQVALRRPQADPQAARQDRRTLRQDARAVRRSRGVRKVVGHDTPTTETQKTQRTHRVHSGGGW